jgi:hypothetical protein
MRDYVARIVFILISILAVVVLSGRCNVFMIKQQMKSMDSMPVAAPPVATVYEQASAASGCPVKIIKGLSFAESSGGKNLKHADPLVKGEFGLNERFHAERAKKFGEYDPEDRLEAATLTGKMYCDNLAFFGDEDKAISAHRKGRHWVIENGLAVAYVARVKENF